jgi:hypothetical protein
LDLSAAAGKDIERKGAGRTIAEMPRGMDEPLGRGIAEHDCTAVLAGHRQRRAFPVAGRRRELDVARHDPPVQKT